jgi:hypothetical protein
MGRGTTRNLLSLTILIRSATIRFTDAKVYSRPDEFGLLDRRQTEANFEGSAINTDCDLRLRRQVSRLSLSGAVSVALYCVVHPLMQMAIMIKLIALTILQEAGCKD